MDERDTRALFECEYRLLLESLVDSDILAPFQQYWPESLSLWPIENILAMQAIRTQKALLVALTVHAESMRMT